MWGKEGLGKELTERGRESAWSGGKKWSDEAKRWRVRAGTREGRGRRGEGAAAALEAEVDRSPAQRHLRARIARWLAARVIWCLVNSTR